jgi:hypothetical protein
MSLRVRLARVEASAPGRPADRCPGCGGPRVEDAIRAATGPAASDLAGQLGAQPSVRARCGGPTIATLLAQRDGRLSPAARSCE